MVKRKSLGASSQSIKNCITSGNMELDDERPRRAMTPTLNGQTAIIRTERGLFRAGSINTEFHFTGIELLAVA